MMNGDYIIKSVKKSRREPYNSYNNFEYTNLLDAKQLLYDPNSSFGRVIIVRDKKVFIIKSLY